MSSTGGGIPPNKSPGKGGKSLEMMQKRLRAQSQQEQQEQAPQSNLAPTTANAPASTPQVAAVTTTGTAAVQRPKGKDFASMSARVRGSPQPQQMLASPSDSNVQAPAISLPEAAGKVIPTQVAPSAQRPKGKDFSAMASRMHHAPAPQTVQQQPPSQHQQLPQQNVRPHQVQQHPPQIQQQPQPAPLQTPWVKKSAVDGGSSILSSQQTSSSSEVERARRAAQMQAEARAAAGLPPLEKLQAEARAAAGLPPLEKPTITSVTTTPPLIPPPRVNRGPSGSSIVPPPASSLPHDQFPSSTVSRTPQQQQQIQLQQQQHRLGQQLSTGQPNAPYIPSDAAQRVGSSGGIRTALHSNLAGQAHQQIPTQNPSLPQQQSVGRRNSKTGTSSTIPPSLVPPTTVAPKSRLPPKPSTRPTAAESRLSNQATSTAIGITTNEPLVGDRVQDLLRTIDPTYVIESKAEEQILELAEDFLEKICRQSIRLAMHRGSKTVDVHDVQLMLHTQWGIVIPGLGAPVARKHPKIASVAAFRAATSGSSGLSVLSTKRKLSSTSLSGTSAANNSGAPSNKKAKTSEN